MFSNESLLLFFNTHSRPQALWRNFIRLITFDSRLLLYVGVLGMRFVVETFNAITCRRGSHVDETLSVLCTEPGLKHTRLQYLYKCSGKLGIALLEVHMACCPRFGRLDIGSQYALCHIQCRTCALNSGQDLHCVRVPVVSRPLSLIALQYQGIASSRLAD